MDSRNRFTQTVDDYDRYRPDYPEAFLAFVEARGPRVVDVGSGTGILSRQLADRGLVVTGVEPNDAMRALAEARGGGPQYRRGDAEATGLPDDAADVVIGAQAFHWFDLARALPELERVSTGWVIAVWNVRTSGGFNAAYDALLHERSADFRAVPKPEPTLEAIQALRPSAQRGSVPHHQDLDREAVLGRAWSSSYVRHGIDDRAAFDQALGERFDAHSHDGSVRMSYDTMWIAWTW